MEYLATELSGPATCCLWMFEQSLMATLQSQAGLA